MIAIVIERAASVIEAVAAIMISASVLGGVVDIALALRHGDLSARITSARLCLAERLVFSIEFLIAADILKTVTTPTLEGMGLLAGVIVIRTVLSLSIAFELRKEAPGSTRARVNPAAEPSS